MNDFSADRTGNGVILVARILLVLLFLIFGWGKLTHYAGTVAYMAHTGAPFPALAALIAIVMEVFVSIAILLGIWTRPLAILMAIYTLATGFIAHHYWTMAGAAQFENKINFYKNVSIMGGFFLLYVTGAGAYSLDARLNRTKA